MQRVKRLQIPEELLQLVHKNNQGTKVRMSSLAVATTDLDHTQITNEEKEDYSFVTNPENLVEHY